MGNRKKFLVMVLRSVDLKRNRVLEGNYMTLEEWMKSEVKEESEKFLKLTSYMAADGRADDIKKLLEEPAFWKRC